MPGPTTSSCCGPLADGGEGTLGPIEAAGGWDVQRRASGTPSADRSPRALAALRRRRASRRRAGRGVGPVAAEPPERDPIGASTVGTGELLRAALDAGARQLVLGIGGSATTDGGAGLLRPWGRRRARRGRRSICGLDPASARPICGSPATSTNPLLGPTGAAATYGPQKGATPGARRRARRAARRAAPTRSTRAAGAASATRPGAGAAGGVGFALLGIQDRFRSFALRPGVDLVMERDRLRAELARADIVITGEGRIDAQTGVRQDRARGGPPGARGRRRLHRGRRRGRAGGDRRRWRRSARSRCRSSSGRRPSRRRWRPGPRRSSAAASGIASTGRIDDVDHRA